MIGSGANLWDVVHVDDVAAALLLAAQRRAGRLDSTTWPTTSRSPIYDFMALTARGARRRAARGASRRRSRGSSPARNAVDAVVRSARSSNAKIKRELGWQPRFRDAPREGVPDAVARLRAR